MDSYFFGKYLSHPVPGEEVVITGLSGRYPESRNVKELSDHLFAKRNLLTDITKRWNIDHPHLPKRSGQVQDLDKIDAGFFGLHYRQAHVMDPSIRKFLEVAVEAVVDAGLHPSELEGTKTGVFVGASFSEVEIRSLMSIDQAQKFGITGYLRCFIPHRVSYFLKLKGPSCVVDTACSSSMVALEMAFKAIRSGKCDNALVGGASFCLHPDMTIQFHRLGVLSHEGVCKVFDQDADGYVRADAVSCILLQRANCARRIYGQVLYAKINDDGFKNEGINFPSTHMQQELMKENLKDAGLSPSDLSYLEAHGTATKVGDREEIEAIDNAIAKHRKTPLWIGSVKCSVGHAEPASGFSSLSKVIIAMETGRIPPNINLKTIKDNLTPILEGRINVVTEERDLEGEEAIVGINNFGFGGSNCHVMIRRFKKAKIGKGVPEDDLPRLVCVSGRTERAVLELLDDVNNQTLDGEYVGLLHHLFKRNINNHLFRGYTIVSKSGPMKSSLKMCTYSPLYVYLGQLGRYYQILGKYLLDFPVFKSIMSRIDLTAMNTDVINVFSKKEADIENDSLGIFLVQIGVLDLLKSLNIHLEAVYGESISDLAIKYYYELITLEEAVSMAYKYIKSSRNRLKSKPFATRIEQYNGFNGPDLNNIAKKGTILNISDNRIFAKDLMLVENGSIQFLQVLGSLYERGYNPQLEKLYPPIEYPVSRGTPMISPSLKWNYEKNWEVFKVQSLKHAEAEHVVFELSSFLDDSKYMTGHVIDGRNLVPAAEYLHMAWQAFIESHRLTLTDTPVVFENCKFIRAVTFPSEGLIQLIVVIHRSSGHFDVLHGDLVVVTGRIYTPTDVSQHKANLPPCSFDESDPSLILTQDEVYRELYLRGYNYSGLFKGIIKCDIKPTTGLVQWENNWTAFIDKMLQMKILQLDTRLLYVPVGVDKLVIDPVEHFQCTNDENNTVLPVYVYQECDIIKSGGIEIRGLQAKSISKRKPLLDPVLEKHVFVPNQGSFDLITSIRINVQIVLENILDNNFKAVELVDESVDSDTEFLLPLVSQVLEDVPSIKPDLIISTKKYFDRIPGVKIENFALTVTSNLSLIVGHQILEKSNFAKILSALHEDGFVLTKEAVNYVPSEDLNIEIIAQYTTDREKLILFRKAKSINSTKYIEISSDNFKWLPNLQQALKEEASIFVYSQNKELDGILGFINCIRREPGGSKVKCLFVTGNAPKFDPEHPLYQNQIKKNLAVNIYKDSKWGTYRHLLLEEITEVEGEHFCVNTTSRGDLSTLKWIKGPLTLNTPLEEDQVLIKNYYSSLNFKDVMIASGRLNWEAFSVHRLNQDFCLGFEFSGKDKEGNRVAGMATQSSLSTLMIADKNFVWNVPDSWTLEEAATVSVVYNTVIYSLLKVTVVKPGTSILIHSATGGVGLAALNVCLYHGCEVFVTVGTQEKRDYLKKHYPQIPDNHIGNSRDTSFEEMIKTGTKGRGVDVVLNSLTEEKLLASVRCLARGGNFVEIGKYDLANNTALNLLLFEREITYHGVMLDRVDAAETKRWMVKKIEEGIRLGFVKPLPRTVFKQEEIESAFRYMTTGKHIGKVLVKVREEDSNTVFRGILRFSCDIDKCYVIIGGLGGLGLELADWLVLKGARKIVLVTSSGVKNGYQSQRLSIWRSYGVTVNVSKANVTTKEGCCQLLHEANALGPIDGIFNLAVILKDALFEDQNEENFQISFAPKANTTIYLDQVSRILCPLLRYFVVFSSVSCGRGNAGQTNYGMANSVMERICERRKREGLPALAIQWGAIGDVGLVAKMQKENKELVIGGTLQQKVSSCFEVLDKLLTQENPVVSSMVVAEKTSRNYGSGSPVDAVAAILGIKDLKTISQHTTLAEMGMDSMMGTEVIQMLEKDFEIYITTKDVRSLTFAKLTEMENEKKVGSKGKSEDKSVQGTNLLLQYIPENKASQSNIIRLPSLANDDKGSFNTVFVFCGIEGVFKPLEPLTRNLKAHVLGVLYNYNNPEDTVEEYAKAILPYMKNYITKDKTFHIVGYSFGVLVALEVVHLLEKCGYVGNVVALDGSPKYSVAAVKQFFPEETEAEFQTSLMFKIMAIALPTDVFTENKDKFLKCETLDERIDLVLSLIPASDSKMRLDKQGGITIYKRFKSVMSYSYAHEKIKSKLSLIKAKYPMITDIENDYKFSEICELPVQVQTVEGDHATMLNQPQLVDFINEMLN